MANIIKPKRSNTAAKVPNTTELTSGELGVNMADRKVYINNGTAVVQVGAGNLSGLGDVAITSPANSQVLSYDSASSTWKNAAAGAGTVTSVSGTAPVASSGGSTPEISLAANYGDTLNPYASKTANNFLAAPNGAAGVPTFRAIVSADIPTLNQNTTGTAANVTGTVAVVNGGTGQTTYTNGQLLIGNTTGNTLAKATLTQGTGITIANGAGSITVTNSAPDQTVALTGAGATTISGTYPNFTISSVNTTYNIATSTVAGLVELASDTAQTVAANAVSATASRTYGLQLNAASQGVINVPWTDTTYSLATSTVPGLIELGSDTAQTVAANAVTATASRTYALQVNADGQGVINVPWTDTNSGGTVTSVSGTGTVSGLTLSGTVTTSGNLTLGGAISFPVTSVSGKTGAVSLVSGDVGLGSVTNLSQPNYFNNTGQVHSTRTSFDATAPSYDFGWRFVQGSTNGPGTGGAQFYSWYVGLGSDYPATGAGSYGAMFAVDRNSTTPYLSVRYNEGNTFTAWQKIRAGYADTSGNVTGTVAIANGGTGATTAANALTNLGAYPASNPNGYTSNAGTVTSVTATAPVASSGGTAPVISMAAATASANGFMTSTYASKLDGIAAGATNVTNTNQLTNGAGFITTPFPAGTAMMFVQTSAPTGWTKSTTHDNKALRVVSGTAGSGGTVAFTTAFASQGVSGSIANTTAAGTVGATTLTTAQIPNHGHQFAGFGGSGSVRANVSMSGSFVSNTAPENTNVVNSTGGGGSHDHTFTGTAHNHTFTGTAINLAVQYVDVIIATKN